MNRETQVILGQFANEETTVQNKYNWVPLQDYSYYSYISVESAPKPKRIEIDIIKQWIIDNNYDRSYLLNLIEVALHETEEKYE